MKALRDALADVDPKALSKALDEVTAEENVKRDTSANRRSRWRTRSKIRQMGMWAIRGEESRVRSQWVPGLGKATASGMSRFLISKLPQLGVNLYVSGKRESRNVANTVALAGSVVRHPQDRRLAPTMTS